LLKYPDERHGNSGLRHTSRRKPDAPKAIAAAPPSKVSPLLPWAIVLLVILLAAAVRIRLLNTPLERDEGEYAYAGQLLLQGIPPYQDAFNLKFPGVYGAYALIMAVCGQTIAGIHLGLLLLNAGTIVLVFLLGRRLFSSAAGVAAAAAYALLSVGEGVFGTQTHATHLVVAAALAATLLLLRATAAKSRASLFAGVFASGALYGIAILMKQHGVFFAAFGALYLFANWKPELLGRNRSSAPETVGVFLQKLTLFVAGVALPLALTAAALWRAGVFGKFWFWTVTYGREYVLETSLSDGIGMFVKMIPRIIGPNLLIWLAAAVGLLALWSRKDDRASGIFSTAFLLVSFLAVCPGLYFREHYFVLMLPALALLAGAALAFLVRVFGSRLAAWLLYGGMLCVSVGLQSDFLFRVSPLTACRQMYSFNPFPEAIPIADYIRTHSNQNARIAVLGSEPEIYFYANRHSATGYIYTYGLMEPQPFALTMQDEMIHDLETARPEYVVYVNVPWSWLRGPRSSMHILDWWKSYSAQNYRVAGVADMFSTEQAEYHWADAESYRPRSSVFLSVYKRKDL
jgi:hypothetical protein